MTSARREARVELEAPAPGRTHSTGRTEYLQSKGYQVLRFWNDQLMNDMEGVLTAILHAQETRAIGTTDAWRHPGSPIFADNGAGAGPGEARWRPLTAASLS